MPYSTAVYTLGLTTGIFFAVLRGLSGLSPFIHIKRFLATLPLGLFIIFFRIFFENPWYETFTPLVTLPFGINIYLESVEFASVLGVNEVCTLYIVYLPGCTGVSTHHSHPGISIPLNRSLSYRYRLETIGYAVGMFFIRSYEQGERTYISMLCRGYGKDSYEHLPKKSIIKSEWVFLLLSLVFIVGNTVGVYLI